MQNSQFPLDLTTNQLGGAIPGLIEYAGEDKKLSTKFKNIGAPRFIFNDEKQMSVTCNLLVDYYDEEYLTKFASITYYNMTIDFDMWLDKNNTLNFVWNTIEMESARVTSDVIPGLDTPETNRHVQDYFNWSFDLILPWIKKVHYIGLNAFYIPNEVPGVIYFEDLKLSVKRNYLAFGMKP
jgi:hypothetical protein